MFKILLLSLTLLGCTAKPVLPKYVDSFSTFEETKKDAAVRLTTESGKVFCSGTVVSAQYVVTAAHCATAVSQIYITDNQESGTLIKVEAVATNERMDLAMLSGDFSTFNTLNLATSYQETVQSSFDVLIFCGFPAGGHLVCESGSNSKLRYWSILTIGYVYPGMSGGMVINPQTNQLMGVIQAMAETGIVWTPTLELLKLLKIPTK